MNPTLRLLSTNLFNLHRYVSSCSSINVYNYVPVAKLHQTSLLLAGHSKWANIKHTKAKMDGQRASLFTRLCRQIRVAIQEGGSSNPETNSSLKSAIELAIKKNMPMSTIQNTIKKFDTNKAEIKEYLLEIKAYNKIYIVCVVYTDNFASLKMNLAPVLKKAKASYVTSKHLFDDMGVIETNAQELLKGKDNIEEMYVDHAIDVGAEEVEIIDEENKIINFLCPPVELARISKNLSDKGYLVERAEHVFIPKATVTIPNGDVKLYEALKEKILAIEEIEGLYDNLDESLLR